MATRYRPEVRYGNSTNPAVNGGTAYLMILNAVESRDGLIHGKLHEDGWSCAIGSFWDVNPKVSLYATTVEEVARVNDSAPHLTKKQRKQMVARWLRWKLTQLGMPGFNTVKAG